MNDFAHQGFPLSEVKRTIHSAYAQTQNFGTKYYEDEDKMNNIRSKISRGIDKKEIEKELSHYEMDKRDISYVVDRLTEEQANAFFWTKNDKGTIRIIHYLFKQFLEESGFYKYCPQGSKNYVFVKVTNNLIDHTSEKEIKDFILDYLLDKDDMAVYNYFADNTRYFKEEFLTLLSSSMFILLKTQRIQLIFIIKIVQLRLPKKKSFL